MVSKSDKKRIKEEKKQAAQRKGARNGLLLKGVGVVITLLAIFVFSQGLLNSAPILAPDQISVSDQVRGADNAPLTITMYADFQCLTCLTEAELVASAWSRISTKVRLVFRHFPLDTHRHAFLAARYAEAASKQDGFWQMHDLLFSNQLLWAESESAEPLFKSYALQLGLDMDKLLVDLESDEVRQKIIADQQGGIRAGVRGTPVLFFNGRRVNNPRSAGELIDMVNDGLVDD